MRFAPGHAGPLHAGHDVSSHQSVREGRLEDRSEHRVDLANSALGLPAPPEAPE